MDPASILNKVIAESATARTISTRRDLKAKNGESVKPIPFNQCPECHVVSAFCLLLPPVVHEKNPKTGLVEEKTYGEAIWECKFCHFQKKTY